jgi:hypothetical protein
MSAASLRLCLPVGSLDVFHLRGAFEGIILLFSRREKEIDRLATATGGRPA